MIDHSWIDNAIFCLRQRSVIEVFENEDSLTGVLKLDWACWGAEIVLAGSKFRFRKYGLLD